MRSGQTSLQEQGRQLESVRDEVSFPLPPLSALLLSSNLLPTPSSHTMSGHKLLPEQGRKLESISDHGPVSPSCLQPHVSASVQCEQMQILCQTDISWKQEVFIIASSVSQTDKVETYGTSQHPGHMACYRHPV